MLEFLPALITLLAFGLGDIPNKAGVKYLSPLQALFTRYLTLTIALWILALGLNLIVVPSPETFGLILFNTLVGASSIAFFFKALKVMDASIANPLGRLSVLLTIAFGLAFFGESLSWLQALGALIILGAAIFISLENKGQNWRLLKGSRYVFLAVLGWGIYFTLLKPIVDSVGPVSTSLFSESMVFIYIALFLLLSKQKVNLAFDRPTGIMVVSGLILLVASLAYSYSVGWIGIALTAAIYTGTPIINAVFSRIILKEKIPAYKYLAIFALVIGLVLLALR